MTATPPALPPTPGPMRQWREELMDLGGPNTLVWPRRDTSEVVTLTRAHPGGVAMLLAGRTVRLGDLVRETESRLAAQRAAARLRARADVIAEEHGLATCFLAMGTATWHTKDEARRPAAPVILRRVDLEPTELDGDMRLHFVADVELNPALVAALRTRIGNPGALTRTLDRGRDTGRGGFNPEPVYAALSALCAQVPGFEITPSLSLGAYPYGKAEAISDLAAVDQAVTAHPVVTRLVGDAPAEQPTPPDPRESRRAPEGVDRSVFDLPEDQQGALDRVAAGEDLFVEAPPGVDAARLVAALVAQCAGDQRRVLVVCEKTGALSAVRERLDAVGLADLALHITDPTAPVDPHVITQRWPEPDPQREGDARASRRDAALAASVLDGHAQAVHLAREPWGVSIADAHDHVVALSAAKSPPRSRVRLPRGVLARLDLDAMEDAAETVERVAAAFGWERRSATSPWWRGRVAGDDDVRRVEDTITTLLDRDLAALETTMAEVFRDITEPVAQSPGDHGRFLSAVERIRDTLDVFRPELFDGPIDPLIDATGGAPGLGMLERRRLVRQARAHLRPGRPPEDLHAALLAAQEQRQAWAALVGGGGRPRIPATIDDAHRAYERVHSALESVEAAAPPADGHLVDLPTDELRSRLSALRRDHAGAVAASGTRADLDALDDLGLGEVVDDLATRRVPRPAVGDELRYVWWMSVLAEIGQVDKRYGAVAGSDLDAALSEFVLADAATVRANAYDLAAEQRRRYRETARGHRRMAHAVAHAAAGRGPGAPRWYDAVSTWGDLLRAAAPCWMTSPLAVGLLLPPEERFDVVVVDDASRTTLARTASALARGGQVVVVGDTTQQRPGTWTTDPAVVPPAPTAPGLADVAEDRLPVVPLRTSGDPRPWLPSARERGVVHTPSPTGDPTPRLRRVDSDTAGAEVELVAALVAEALADPSSSLGVVTFDEAHAAAIRSAVADTLRARPELAAAAAALPAPFVVKPVLRWQREQRDRVVVSVGPVSAPGSGAPSTGATAALMAPGGDRLVATALTRGRHQVDWVTGLRAAGLAGAPKTSGVEALRHVLVELEADPTPVAGTPRVEPGPLVVGFVERLRSAGLEVELGVGQAGHRVDIAVGDPDHPGYQLAVSIDGPEYATRAGARQRDRILPGELTALGWRHLRLWATDIFADPARQEAKVLRALHQACVEIDRERGR
ncbi:DUF4011 domain-containing protein [Janibacter melonis]|uniref:DUF4011 domain-containing protein n=1 Tax=Janibacter melonis TaxID=262209 RepID=UPI0017486F28|nr:DUF4011 domain-containing protein [Janibacter melonis]